jgi:hypothetical protein
MTKMKVTDYPRASVLQDGSLIELEMKDATKQSVVLQFDPDALDGFVSRIIQLLADARNQKHAKSGHPGISALAAAAAGAGPVAGGTHVIVFLKTNTGTEFHFALPTRGAEQLSEHIAAAVASAREQAGQTRQ